MSPPKNEKWKPIKDKNVRYLDNGSDIISYVLIDLWAPDHNGFLHFKTFIAHCIFGSILATICVITPPPKMPDLFRAPS